MLDTSGFSGTTSVALTAGVVAAQTGITVVTMTHADILLTLLGLIVVGLLVGLGQGLAHVPPLTARQIIGKSLVSMGVAICAVLAYKLDPSMNPLLIIGAGSLLSVLGSGFLEAYVRNKLGMKPKEDEDGDSTDSK